MLAIPISNGTVRIVSLAELKNSPDWQRVFANKAKDHRYYEIVDEARLGDFEHHYMILEDNSGRIRGIQPLFFVRQNLVEGVPGKIRNIVDFIRKAFPRFLTMRVLMVGCTAGAGELGVCDPGDGKWIATALREALLPFARQNKASLIVLKDFYSKYRQVLESFSENGYARIPSMPMTRLSLRYSNFDEYLGSIGYMTRKGLRRKFKKAEKGAKIEMEVVNDVSPLVDEIYPLYLQVHERSPLKFETLTKDYFHEVSQRMPDRARFFIWRQEGKIIAFTLCLVHDDIIHDECLGLDYRVALELSLYFYTMRDLMNWAFANGICEYRSGPLNYDPKLHLGHELMPLDLYVMHTSPLLNPIFKPFVKLLEPTRHDRVIQQFPNVKELN